MRIGERVREARGKAVEEGEMKTKEMGPLRPRINGPIEVYQRERTVPIEVSDCTNP